MRVKIGVVELELLRHLHQVAPASVRDVHQDFGVPRGYARGTVLQMMERLRKKGFLSREDVDKTYHYSTVRAPADFEEDIVAGFVSGHLGGSIRPFINYLERPGSLSESDIDELRLLVEKLSAPD